MKAVHYLLACACLASAAAAVADTATRTDRAGWAGALAAARTAYLASSEAHRAPDARFAVQALRQRAPGRARSGHAGRGRRGRTPGAAAHGSLRAYAGQLQHLGRAEADRQGRDRDPAHGAETGRSESRLGAPAGRQELAGPSAADRRPHLAVRPVGSLRERVALRPGRPVRAIRGPGGRGSRPRRGAWSASGCSRRPRRCRRAGPRSRRSSPPSLPGSASTPAATESPLGSRIVRPASWSKRSSARCSGRSGRPAPRLPRRCKVWRGQAGVPAGDPRWMSLYARGLPLSPVRVAGGSEVDVAAPNSTPWWLPRPRTTTRAGPSSAPGPCGRRSSTSSMRPWNSTSGSGPCSASRPASESGTASTTCPPNGPRPRRSPGRCIIRPR